MITQKHLMEHWVRMNGPKNVPVIGFKFPSSPDYQDDIWGSTLYPYSEVTTKSSISKKLSFKTSQIICVTCSSRVNISTDVLKTIRSAATRIAENGFASSVSLIKRFTNVWKTVCLCRVIQKF